MNNAWPGRIRAAQAAAILAMAVCPGAAAAQQRPVPADIPSAAEFAATEYTVRLTRPTDAAYLLAASWNGGTAAQSHGYLVDGIVFPSPVLTYGLPSPAFGGRSLLAIGRNNWLRPGADAAFQPAFRGHPGFITLVDLLRANPVRTWSVNANLVETFQLPEGSAPPVPAFAGQRVIRSPIQAGVQPGHVRYQFLATAQLTPNCAGRPAALVGATADPARVRTYLNGVCQPLDPSSVEGLFGYRRPAPRFGGAVSVRFTVRANPGDVVIPRSSGYQGPLERAALDLPTVAADDAALRAASRDELVDHLSQLAPATVPGLVPEDMRAAAQAAVNRIKGVLDQPLPVDQARIDAAAQAAHDAGVAQFVAERRVERLRTRLASVTSGRDAARGLFVLVFAAFCLVLWRGFAKIRALQASLVDRDRVLASMAQERADLVEEAGLAIKTADSVVDQLDRAGLESEAAAYRARRGSLAPDAVPVGCLHAALAGAYERLSVLLPPRQSAPLEPDRFVTEPPKRLVGAAEITGVRRLSQTTPVPVSPSGLDRALHGFLQGIIELLYPERVAAADPRAASIRARFLALGPQTPKEEVDDLIRTVLEGLRAATSDGQLRAHAMLGLAKVVRTMASERHAPSWTLTKSRLIAVGDLLADPHRELRFRGDWYEPVQEAFQRKTTAQHAAGGQKESGRRSSAPPAQARPSRPG